MEKIRGFRDLHVWQLAMDLAQSVHRVTSTFPKEEQYGPTSQIRRAAVSIPSNIAEGHSRNGKREFIHFLGIASGSMAELTTQLMLANRFSYIPDIQIEQLLADCEKVGKMLSALKNSLRE